MTTTIGDVEPESVQDRNVRLAMRCAELKRENERLVEGRDQMFLAGEERDAEIEQLRGAVGTLDEVNKSLRAEVEQKEVLLKTMDHWAEVAETCERKSNEWASVVAKVEALADDMDERGRPGTGDSPMDAQARRQIREDVKRLRTALASVPPDTATPGEAINIIFDGPPSHESGRFVESETDDGRGIRAGEWIERPDGLWALRITSLPVQSASSADDNLGGE